MFAPSALVTELMGRSLVQSELYCNKKFVGEGEALSNLDSLSEY
ncbi:hypothetical protein RB3695 [Rhodopirellula baltica SH 1]|uniref:Uncharacterized protein n=1 Tax=Rhodopirellula baltica (strain DSM 10527 / NCIMB 13988 / SH1) TaxID=243090 RepID=Q7UTT2_RHOBA|nr:hypothetical protein RB3695 [Rhodopirellula baltica SH 1]